MQLSFISTLALFPFVSAFDSVQIIHHHRLRRADITANPPSSVPAASTLSLPSSVLLHSLPSVTQLSPSFTSSSSVPAQSTIASSTLPPSPSSTSTPPSSSVSSAAFPSSTSSITSTYAVTSTPSATPTSVAALQPQSSSSTTPIISLGGAGTLAQDSPTSVVVLTSTTATPSSTATQSSSSGFFSNTGAVAGTFTVVGLVSVAGVIAVVLLIARRRHSTSYEEDAEYLDKSLSPSVDPSISHIASVDHGSSPDHTHYGSPPMALATPPTLYYPDHAYALHPQAFLPEMHPPLGPQGYPSSYPVVSAQDYAAQHIYSPEGYNTTHYPSNSRGGTNVPDSREFTDVELDSASVPQTQTVLPRALRPSVLLTPSAPKQWANSRFSVDSFYAGISTDTPPIPGQAR